MITSNPVTLNQNQELIFVVLLLKNTNVDGSKRIDDVT
jgi:hypothetical protein